jgi:hypothetical protein
MGITCYMVRPTARSHVLASVNNGASLTDGNSLSPAQASQDSDLRSLRKEQGPESPLRVSCVIEEGALADLSWAPNTQALKRPLWVKS